MLYRIWHYDSNDRSEVARIKATDFDVVQKFLLKTFIQPQYQSDVEETDFGLEWTECDQKECLDMEEKCGKCIHRSNDYTPHCTIAERKEDFVIEECKDYELDDNAIYDICERCETPIYGFEIKEVENADGKSWGETFEFRTIMGTNEYYDLTTKDVQNMLKVIEAVEDTTTLEEEDRKMKTQVLWDKIAEISKASDFNPLLAKAWRKDAQLGLNVLIATPELTPQKAIDKKYLEECKKKKEEFKKEVDE